MRTWHETATIGTTMVVVIALTGVVLVVAVSVSSERAVAGEIARVAIEE